MKKITLALSAAALALAGGAAVYAAPAMMGGKMDKDMTRAEATTMANTMWTKLDVNQDGMVNQADRDAKRAARFDRMDANKDGSISRDEFAAGHRGGMGGHQRGGHAGMNHEGGPEMAGEMNHGKHGGKHGRRGGMRMGMMMMHMADANKDGSVSRAEYDAGVTQHFDMVDTNRDGTITKPERQAAHAAMKARMETMRAAPAAGQ